jgi:DNA-binding SARP family transcriptional activator
MSILSIHLFGKLFVQCNEQILDVYDALKVQELFCYLLLHWHHSLPRETLASMLWSETTTVQSKKNLRQALWQLQSERYNLIEEELDISPSKPPFQFVKEIIFSAFLTPNGEWNESIP